MGVPTVEWMRRWLPPQCIIHVGAGAGAGVQHVWRSWGIERALLIDADRDRLVSWAGSLLADRPGWRMAGVTLAEVEGELDFYRASNPSEDGLVEPKQLTGLWPNLHALSHAPCQVRRLDAVLEEFEGGTASQAGHVWTVIDCLPALPILKGAGERVAQWSVLWLRVLLRPTGMIEEGALLHGVVAFLAPLGFRCVDVQEGHHPSIGHALFVRDWRDALLARVGDFQAQCHHLTQEHAVLASQRDRLAQDVQDMARVNEAQSTRLAQDAGAIATLQEQVLQAQATVTALRQECAGHLSQVEEQLSLLQVLRQSEAQLLQDKATQAALGQALAEERDACVERLKTQETHANEQAAAHRALEQERVAIAIRRDVLEQEVRDLQVVQSERVALLGEREEAVQALTRERSALLAQLAATQADGESLKKVLDDQLAQQQAAIEDLTRQCHGQNALTAQWQSQFEAQAGQIEAQRQQIQAQREQIEASLASQEALAGVAARRQSSLDGLTAENLQLKDRLAGLEAELLQRSEALATVESAWKEKEALFARLESESGELERRQQGISDEMLRAGAQIDLIKDILVQGALLADAEPPAQPMALAIKGEQKADSRGRKRRATRP